MAGDAIRHPYIARFCGNYINYPWTWHAFVAFTHTRTLYVVEIVLERVLVLFRPEEHRFSPVSEHFLFRHRTMQSVFATCRYLAYNMTTLQSAND